MTKEEMLGAITSVIDNNKEIEKYIHHRVLQFQEMRSDELMSEEEIEERVVIELMILCSAHLKDFNFDKLQKVKKDLDE